mmetsp:Transcript_4440/g.9561  ORF Transcript_4440/g.9561 Transcript_4440/m.9561 type:complete len:214 (-) Transcript_4440:42-683(-)
MTLKTKIPRKITFQYCGEDYFFVPASPDHAPEMCEALRESLPDMAPFMCWASEENATPAAQYGRLAAAFKTYFDDEGDYMFHLFRAGRFIGSVALMHRAWGKHVVEVGYWVRSQESKKGLATVSTKIMLYLCWEVFHFKRVLCCHNNANVGSQKVIEKAGFVKESEHRWFEDATEEMIAAGCSEYTSLYALMADSAPKQDLSDLDLKIEFYPL